MSSIMTAMFFRFPLNLKIPVADIPEISAVVKAGSESMCASARFRFLLNRFFERKLGIDARHKLALSNGFTM
jgi:hypothetical protein